MKANRLYINEEAILHNYKEIKKQINKNSLIVPIVKANAYGVGLKEVVTILNEATTFAVANIDEASELKKIRPEVDIVILYQPLPEDIPEIIKNNYIVIASDIKFLKLLNKKTDIKIRVHIEVDTGMSRFGINKKNAEKFAKEVEKLENILVEGICTHYSSANNLEPEDILYTKKQTDLFKDISKKMELIIGKIKYLHASSGAGIFHPYAENFNMVRPGYILYGYYADDNFKELIDLKPALKLVTKIIQINEYEEGTKIGYNGSFITKRKTKVAVIAMGYSHGLFQCLSNKSNVIINNEKAPIIGNICMDVSMVDITDLKGKAKVADDVYIFDNDNITIKSLVDSIGTTGYEFLARINPTVTKIIK